MNEDSVFTINHPRPLSALALMAPAEHRDEEKPDNFIYFHADLPPSLSQSASREQNPQDAEPTYLTHASCFSHHLCAAEAAARSGQITITSCSGEGVCCLQECC